MPSSAMMLVFEKLSVFLQGRNFRHSLTVDVLGGLALILIAAHRRAGLPDSTLFSLIAALQAAPAEAAAPAEPVVTVSAETKAEVDGELGRILAGAYDVPAAGSDDEPKTAVEVALEMLRLRDEADG